MDVLEKKNQLAEYEKSLKSLTLEQLKEKEQEIIKEADENDKAIASKEFKLPGENYKTVANGIRTLLEKQTVEWRFTLGMVSMYDFWDPENFPTVVTYPMLDATLRTLGEMKFTGYSEWAAVVAINKYFESLHDEYESATEKIYDIASKHNAIIDELGLREPVGGEKAEN